MSRRRTNFMTSTLIRTRLSQCRTSFRFCTAPVTAVAVAVVVVVAAAAAIFRSPSNYGNGSYQDLIDVRQINALVSDNQVNAPPECRRPQ